VHGSDSGSCPQQAFALRGIGTWGLWDILVETERVGLVLAPFGRYSAQIYAGTRLLRLGFFLNFPSPSIQMVDCTSIWLRFFPFRSFPTSNSSAYLSVDP
jgi:hypothetical protein